MSCPTCDHPMQRLTQQWFWCPRCGTVINRINEIPFEKPLLVKRCIYMIDSVKNRTNTSIAELPDIEVLANFHVLGVSEAVGRDRHGVEKPRS